MDFEEIIRTLNHIGYTGPLSIEWEDSGMERERGATEACAFTKHVDFAPSNPRLMRRLGSDRAGSALPARDRLPGSDRHSCRS